MSTADRRELPTGDGSRRGWSSALNGGAVFAEQTGSARSSLIAGHNGRAADGCVAAGDRRQQPGAGRRRPAVVRVRRGAPAGPAAARRAMPVRPAAPRPRWTRRRTIAEECAWREWPTRPAGAGDLSPSTRSGWRTCTGRCARRSRTARTSRARATSTTARWRCAATRPRRRERSAGSWRSTGCSPATASGRRGRSRPLFVVIAVVGVLLAVWGQPPADAARIAVGAVVLRDPGTKLTEAGPVDRHGRAGARARVARAGGAGGTSPGQAVAVSRRGPCAARRGPRRAAPP